MKPRTGCQRDTNTASIQEIDSRSKEVYTYTSLLRLLFSVRGAKEVTLAGPLGVGQGARQRRRGGNGAKIAENNIK